MIREGARVSYAGSGSPGVGLGDQGRVLADVGSGCYVRWLTGAQEGQTSLVAYDDVVTASKEVSIESSLDDSLGYGPIAVVAVRATYDLGGDEGLVGALSEQGHLASLAAYAEDALAELTGKMREDPVLHEVVASLGPDEEDSFMSYLAHVLLRDALKED